MHDPHVDAPSLAWNVPAAQVVHAVADASEYLPAAHALHSVELAVVEQVPAGHAVHVPTTATYLPASQAHGERNPASHAELGSDTYEPEYTSISSMSSFTFVVRMRIAVADIGAASPYTLRLGPCRVNDADVTQFVADV